MIKKSSFKDNEKKLFQKDDSKKNCSLGIIKKKLSQRNNEVKSFFRDDGKKIIF